MSRVRRGALLLGALLAAAGPLRAQPPAPAYRWPPAAVERDALAEALPAGALPERFEAVVGEVGPPRPGAAPTLRWCSWRDSAREGRFWPASTVKLLGAIGLLERLRELGAPPSAVLRFDFPERPERGLPPRPGEPWPEGARRAAERIEARAEALVRRALVPSDNRAFDLMVYLVGFRWLHERLLVPERGLGRTVLQRGYSKLVREPRWGHGTLRYAPPRQVRWAGGRVDLPAEWSAPREDCPREGTCTTLLQLAAAMARVALHEELPSAERFRLDPEAVRLLHAALGARRPRGNGVVDGLRRGFGARGERLRLLHKPGYAYRWFSDVVFLEDGARRWVVAMAGWPGRGALDRAAEALGRLLASGWRCPPVGGGGAAQPGSPRPSGDEGRTGGRRPGGGP